MPKPRAGDVVEIDLGDGTKAVARVLDPPLIEFFDLRANVRAPLNAAGVEGLGVLFRVYVMDRAIRSRRWPIIGRHPVSAAHWTGPERFFKKDPISGELSIYWDDRASGEYFERPATFEEYQRMERAAVWDPEHVEDRLRDHFNGEPNKWVESLRLR